MPNEDTRCPTCGTGVFVGVSYLDPDPKADPGVRGPGSEPEPSGARVATADHQTGGSFEVLTFSCGHEVRGPELAVADTDRLTVEERTAEETVDRPMRGGGAP